MRHRIQHNRVFKNKTPRGRFNLYLSGLFLLAVVFYSLGYVNGDHDANAKWMKRRGEFQLRRNDSLDSVGRNGIK